MLDFALDFCTPAGDVEIAMPFLPPLPPLVLKGSETKGESFFTGLNSFTSGVFAELSVIFFSLFLIKNRTQF